MTDDLLRRAEQLCNLILDHATEEETSTHVAVSWDEPDAARIHLAAQLLRRKINAEFGRPVPQPKDTATVMQPGVSTDD